MIYLKKPDLLFIKPLKTASTSVEIALSCNATPEDIVTPISLNYELLRLEKNGQLPVNYALDRKSERRYRRRIQMLAKLHARFPRVSLERFNGILKLICRGGGKRLFYNHIKPTEIVRRTSEAFLQHSFVVTMCRHPYEVLVSRVYWERWKKDRISAFDVGSAVDAMLENEPLNLDYYFYKGEYIPDFVIKYETLLDNLLELEKRFGLKLTDNLPFTKNKVRTEKKPAREVLTDRQKAVCYEKNKPIFEKFGYEK